MQILILASLILALAAGAFSQSTHSKKAQTANKKAVTSNSPAQESPAKAAEDPNPNPPAGAYLFGFGIAAIVFGAPIFAIIMIMRRRKQMQGAQQVSSTSENHYDPEDDWLSKENDWMFYNEPPHEYDRDADD
jgi:hypothetical protein